jgi:hypothetical protein
VRRRGAVEQEHPQVCVDSHCLTRVLALSQRLLRNPRILRTGGPWAAPETSCYVDPERRSTGGNDLNRCLNARLAIVLILIGVLSMSPSQTRIAAATSPDGLRSGC